NTQVSTYNHTTNLKIFHSKFRNRTLKIMEIQYFLTFLIKNYQFLAFMEKNGAQKQRRKYFLKI
ncbi:hypothetical protein, partial [Hungatella effluvii]|uniref:hypothetical protein n=1 Tax=Hungatella effluvii TaxID=1096246 RepID=UPI002A81E290